MKQTKVIGITGGIGAGKSVVLNYIESHYRARIFMTDNLAHVVMEPGTACNKALQEIFPPEVFEEDGRIRKEELAKAMYRKEELRTRLNEIVHPAVGEYLRDEVAKEKEKNDLDYVIIESALYNGSDFALLCDEVWNIRALPEVRAKRLMAERGYSAKKVSEIFESQKSYDAMRQTLPVQIDNNGDLNETFSRIARELERLSK